MPLSIGVGVGVPFVRSSGGGAPAFDPINLPNPIYRFDFGDPATQFADTGGTTPAGDGVGDARVNDKFGTGRNVSQAVGTQRPTRDASFNPSVVFTDGTDRLFSAAFAAINQPFTLGVVSDNLVVGGSFFDHGTGATRVAAARVTDATTVQIFAGAALTATVPNMAVRRAYLFEFNGANSKIWVFDGTTFVQAGSTGNAGTNTLADLRLFGNASGFLTSAAASDFTGHAAVFTSQQRGDFGAFWKARWNL